MDIHTTSPTQSSQPTPPAYAAQAAQVVGRAAVPLPLPFDDESETPIPFVLTAAAQRGVLGRDLPPLSVVPAAAEPVDTRPVQARALMRSGMQITTIAAALGVDAATIAGWTEDLADELARRRRHVASRRSSSPGVRALPVLDAVSDVDRPPVSAEHRSRLLSGLAFALAEVDEHGVTILHDRVDTVVVILDRLREMLPGLAGRMRVALRVGTELPADRTAAEVAGRLGLEREAIIVGRGGVGSGSSLEIRVDVRDASAAEIVRAWRDGSSSAASGLRGWDSNPQTFRLTADCSAN